MRSSWGIPIAGVLAAIAITTTMDATGYSDLSALPLLPLMALFWWLDRIPRREMGFVRGRRRDYGMALLYPVFVMVPIVLVAAATGAIDTSETDWNKAWLNLALVSISTVLVGILTEEGFFRGWLWASLRKRGAGPVATLICTSLAFSLWHLSAVSLNTGFDLPVGQIPVYMVNATLLGAVWGMLRWLSGSIIVASVSHGAWNGMAYVFFGFSTKTGALGIEETTIYGPEVGVLGIVLNAAFLAALWRWGRGTEYDADRGAESV